MSESFLHPKYVFSIGLLVSMSTLADSAHAQLDTLVPYDTSMVTNRWVRGVDVSPNDWPPPPHGMIDTRDPAPFGFSPNFFNHGWRFVVDNTGGTGTPPPDLVSFEIDFQQPQSITSMRLYSSWTDGPQGAEHRLEHSDDGSNWFHNDGLTFQWETTVGGGVNDAGNPELTGGGYGGWYDWSFNNAQIPHQHWRIASTGDISKLVNNNGPKTAALEFYTSGTFVPPPILDWSKNDAGSWIDPNNWQQIGGATPDQ